MPDHSLRVAIYARVSGEQQAKEDTIDSQIEAVTQRIADDGLVCDPELRFIDDGVSGTVLLRPGLERLRDQAAAGALDRLYVHDPDRFSRKYAYQVLILEELATYGTPPIKRAYGDWTTTNLNGWKKALNHHAIQPVQQFAYTVGKNSSDSALIIDAMDLLWMGNVDAFALVSSDSDFTRLATRLREGGKRVIGLGARKTPASLRNAVDQFIYLELLGTATDHDVDDDETVTTPTAVEPV